MTAASEPPGIKAPDPAQGGRRPQIGDFIHVYWNDSSKVDRGAFGPPECLAHHYGIFAGVWGKKKRHVRLYFGEFADGYEATFMDILEENVDWSRLEVIIPGLVLSERIQRIRRYSQLLKRRGWA